MVRVKSQKQTLKSKKINNLDNCLLAPRPGLEPGTCGLTGQGRAGRGATKLEESATSFSAGEARRSDAPNLFRTARVGIRPTARGPPKRNNGLRAGPPNCDRTAGPRTLLCVCAATVARWITWDAEVVEGIQHSMTMLPDSTITVVEQRGLRP